MWANVQPRRHPSQLQYSLNKVTHWRPLFGRQFANPRAASVQSTPIEYQKTPMKFVRRLEEFIVDHLKQSFMKWRKTLRFVTFHVLELCAPLPITPRSKTKTRYPLHIFGMSCIQEMNYFKLKFK
jgi:hypothetical protein